MAYGCLGSGGCSKGDLQKAIDNYNNNIVGTRDAKGALITTKLALPSSYEFDEPSFTQDFRLTKTFTLKERFKINILGEMFNAFNISNLSGISHTLDPATSTAPVFGQPTQRANQTFGSGGPRAVQVGARVTF